MRAWTLLLIFITQHIANIYKDEKLAENPTRKNFLRVQTAQQPLTTILAQT